MGTQLSKQDITVGLLAHVSASRREPHIYSYIPDPKNENFLYLRRENYFKV